jgi:hypothetical protein
MPDTPTPPKRLKTADALVNADATPIAAEHPTMQFLTAVVHDTLQTELSDLALSSAIALGGIDAFNAKDFTANIIESQEYTCVVRSCDFRLYEFVHGQRNLPTITAIQESRAEHHQKTVRYRQSIQIPVNSADSIPVMGELVRGSHCAYHMGGLFDWALAKKNEENDSEKLRAVRLANLSVRVIFKLVIVGDASQEGTGRARRQQKWIAMQELASISASNQLYGVRLSMAVSSEKTALEAERQCIQGTSGKAKAYTNVELAEHFCVIKPDKEDMVPRAIERHLRIAKRFEKASGAFEVLLTTEGEGTKHGLMLPSTLDALQAASNVAAPLNAELLTWTTTDIVLQSMRSGKSLCEVNSNNVRDMAMVSILRRRVLSDLFQRFPFANAEAVSYMINQRPSDVPSMFRSMRVFHETFPMGQAFVNPCNVGSPANVEPKTKIDSHPKFMVLFEELLQKLITVGIDIIDSGEYDSVMCRFVKSDPNGTPQTLYSNEAFKKLFDVAVFDSEYRDYRRQSLAPAPKAPSPEPAVAAPIEVDALTTQPPETPETPEQPRKNSQFFEHLALEGEMQHMFDAVEPQKWLNMKKIASSFLQFCTYTRRPADGNYAPSLNEFVQTFGGKRVLHIIDQRCNYAPRVLDKSPWSIPPFDKEGMDRIMKALLGPLELKKSERMAVRCFDNRNGSSDIVLAFNGRSQHAHLMQRKTMIKFLATAKNLTAKNLLNYYLSYTNSEFMPNGALHLSMPASGVLSHDPIETILMLLSPAFRFQICQHMHLDKETNTLSRGLTRVPLIPGTKDNLRSELPALADKKTREAIMVATAGTTEVAPSDDQPTTADDAVFGSLFDEPVDTGLPIEIQPQPPVVAGEEQIDPQVYARQIPPQRLFPWAGCEILLREFDNITRPTSYVFYQGSHGAEVVMACRRRKPILVYVRIWAREHLRRPNHRTDSI